MLNLVNPAVGLAKYKAVKFSTWHDILAVQSNL